MAATHTYNGGAFIELMQPLVGHSMFHDYRQSKKGIIFSYFFIYVITTNLNNDFLIADGFHMTYEKMRSAYGMLFTVNWFVLTYLISGADTKRGSET